MIIAEGPHRVGLVGERGGDEETTVYNYHIMHVAGVRPKSRTRYSPHTSLLRLLVSPTLSKLP